MTSMLTKLMPFLNKALPAGLALKGMSKINPKFGNFVTDSLSAGYTADNIIDYARQRFGNESDLAEERRLKQKSAQGNIRPDEERALKGRKDLDMQRSLISSGIGLAAGGVGALGDGMVSGLLGGGQQQPQQAQPQAPQAPQQPQGNIIQQVSPELFNFLQNQVQKGRDPIQAGAIAQASKAFSPVIKKLESLAGAKFSEILSMVFGGQESPIEAMTQQRQQQNQQALQQNQAALYQQDMHNKQALQQQAMQQGQSALQPQQQSNANAQLIEAMRGLKDVLGR